MTFLYKYDKKIIMSSIGEILEQIRKGKQLTQVEVANRAGIAPITVSRIENDFGSPTLEVIEKIASVLETSVAEIYQKMESDSSIKSSLTAGEKIKFRRLQKNLSTEYLSQLTEIPEARLLEIENSPNLNGLRFIEVVKLVKALNVKLEDILGKGESREETLTEAFVKTLDSSEPRSLLERKRVIKALLEYVKEEF